ncbi:putative HD superfamily hydrolase of NAD metabolism [Alkalispirochaeta americana]|uniref:bis(5'-nucleosyl)-tetraphosphatase (symmetrical) n=1 Tax=Alkalispirochaeta americana TaxID=159291 RepID=A0A1N6R0C4_9SPIO|nr:bis(5'-nucleosyl)-tetraphosphatase (symmetrical) YqeK [Alkalispirochaeta americana]SIQ22330.1 putative HD superfamily hydrolase of NAD metabolism [Alkalispirochaeta americana]
MSSFADMIPVIERLERELPRFLSPDRYSHTLRVRQVAEALGRRFSLPLLPVGLAALAHDLERDRSHSDLLSCARERGIPLARRDLAHPVLLHGPVAADRLRREYHVVDEAVLQAVRHHTLGHPCFAEPSHQVGQVLFVADFCDPLRASVDGAMQEEILALADLPCMVREVIARTRAIFGELEEPTEQLYARLNGVNGNGA